MTILKKDIIKYRQIELLVATGAYLLLILLVFLNSASAAAFLFNKDVPFQYNADDFFDRSIRLTGIYVAFSILNFRLVYRLLTKERLLLNLLKHTALFLLLSVILGMAATYIKFLLSAKAISGSQFMATTTKSVFVDSLVASLAFALYLSVQNRGWLPVRNLQAIPAKYSAIIRDCLMVVVIWLASLILLILGEAEKGAILLWCTIVPFAILHYWYLTLVVLPSALIGKKMLSAFVIKEFSVLAVATLTLFIAVDIIINDDGPALEVCFLNVFFQLFITVPVSWIIFNRREKAAEKLKVLQQELGQSNASLDFLRAQINPHFLFNSLNTIYAIAINENAERTSEAVEKLADMMRFMLHENMQEKIALARELNYLDNYIALQKLRTEHNPALAIQTHLQEPDGSLAIAPMLLIPFVENAFKHGISFRDPSEINISLRIEGTKLTFEVYNTKHNKQMNDPETHKSGIGLNNVKNRLQLLYPSSHQLIVSETPAAFSVHLIIDLS